MYLFITLTKLLYRPSEGGRGLIKLIRTYVYCNDLTLFQDIVEVKSNGVRNDVIFDIYICTYIDV